MQAIGQLQKMRTALEANNAQYEFILGENVIDMNKLIGTEITTRHLTDINCIACGRKITKTFNSGYCFPCFKNLAECDLCIVKPEKCHYHLGTCREADWGEQHCMQDHYVYLANSSGLKVGITRARNIPSRWIDQGAIQAIPIAKTASRRLAGLLEVELAKYVPDNTNWREMLQGNIESLDLFKLKRDVLTTSSDEIEQLQQQFSGKITILEDNNLQDILYPVLAYPDKITSLNFDKTPEITGTLMGIKAQYLIFDVGVLNIRKFAGYNVTVEI